MTMNDATSKLTRRGFCAGAAGAAAATIGFNRLAGAADADSSQMISQLAKFKLNPEAADEAVAALKELCAAVEASEPDVLVYICHRSTKAPEELVFFEVYKNKEALAAHGKTPHLGKLRMSFAKLFRPPLEIVPLERVGGFARA
jgi:quinol monooxygenase YgiN